MRIAFLPTSAKQIAKLPKREKVKVFRIIRRIASDPFVGKVLRGELQGLRSARAWPYRIIYRVFKEKNLLVIETVQHRQRAYK